MRSFEVKVNRKARRTALRGVLSHHAANGTLAILDGSGFDAPSTRKAAELLAGWGERPTLVVVHEDEELLVKSFRNLEKVLVTVPARARGRLARLGALGRSSARRRCRSSSRAPASAAGGGGGMSLHPNQVLLAPVVSEKSYSLITDRKYTFKVHEDAHKTQIRQAVEELFEVKVAGREHRQGAVQAEAPRLQPGSPAGLEEGDRRSCREGYEIEIFEGAAV